MFPRVSAAHGAERPRVRGPGGHRLVGASHRLGRAEVLRPPRYGCDGEGRLVRDA